MNISKQIKTYFFAVIHLIFIFKIHGAELIDVENQNTGIHYIVIPGIINCGGEHVMDHDILHPSSDQHVDRITTPSQIDAFDFQSYADFGQKNCQEHMQKGINPKLEKDDIQKIILHASSQGTASLINYVASLSPQDQKKIGALILESAMASGNSAIFHCVTQTFRLGCLRYGLWLRELPLSQYWIPMLSLVSFPFYNPTGTQPIFMIDKLPKDLPIIILHSIRDKILPYDGAIALYTRLRHQENSFVYFIRSERNLHINLLKTTIEDKEYHDDPAKIKKDALMHIQSLNAIFKRHGLPYKPLWKKGEEPRLADLQPHFSDAAYKKYTTIEKNFQNMGAFWQTYKPWIVNAFVTVGFLALSQSK